ncbi:MAG: PAS domain S-box protein [Spirochaetes bacterium]|nr:PAS domain S-box protein [Spirochaetota bacterium]
MENPKPEPADANIVPGMTLDAETRLKLILENTQDSYWISDLSGKTIYMSPSVERQLGYTVGEYLGMTLEERLPAESAKKMTSVLHEAIEGARLGLFRQGSPGISFELLHRHKNGRLVWGEVHASIVFDDGGLPVAVNGITRNIDERKRYEMALKASETRYRAILSQIPDAVVIHRKGTFVFVSDAIEKITGFKPHELVGRSIVDFSDPAEVPRLNEIGNKREAGEPVPGFHESRILSTSGEYRDMEVRATLLEMDDKLFTIAVLTDITERKRADEAARETEGKYRDLVDLLPTGVFETDLNGRAVYVNDQMYRLFGYDWMNDPLPSSIFDTIAPECREQAGENMRRIAGGESIGPREYTCLRKDGTRFDVQIHSSVFLRNGAPIGMRGVMLDITDRKLRERELLKANKLEAIGVLAGGIAHDFNNILTAVMGNLSLAAIEDGLPAEARNFIVEAERQIIRARDLTGRLMLVAKGGVIIRKDAPVAEIIGDVVDFNLKGSKSSYWVRFGDDVPAIGIDGDSFSQIVTSLVINASQAMPKGGVIEIDVSRHGSRKRSAKARDAAGEAGLPAGDYLCLSIRDEGIGIPPENLDRIFDPYFSTKPGGSGLGLAVVQAIVEKNGGRITVQSRPNEGTRFAVYLPAADRPA